MSSAIRTRREHHFPSAFKLNLTPMLDMFTFVLIFLIVSFAPQEAKVSTHPAIQLPEATAKLQKASKVQIQLLPEALLVNGRSVKGFRINDQSQTSWNALLHQLKSLGDSKETVILSADRETSFGSINRLVSKLSSFGYNNIYFLGVKKGSSK